MAQKYRLLLPKTAFPLRTVPATSDPATREAAQFDQLYRWQQDSRAEAPPFVLHDGPPYANGSPHMGHALNKILKDIINRYKLLRGYKVHYRPGWDCHGLPIELKACRDSDSASVAEIRSKASSFAVHALQEQKEAFQKWGCLGDWDNPYLTMHSAYEADQIGVFYEMYKKGCVYQGVKPVYWSPSSRTALAEAELEYKVHTSQSVYALFPVTSKGGISIEGSGEISALVWTTTPWTLVANRAVCYHPNHSYSLVEIQRDSDGKETVLIGTKCLEEMGPLLGNYKVVGVISGSQLEGAMYRNPIDKSGKLRPFLPAQHVGDREGTGLVHTAPSHGHDDYSVGVKYGLDLNCLVDGKGQFCDEAGAELAGLDVLDSGNKAILVKLREVGASLVEHAHEHRYPYDWRTKKPVIIRATKQWFADVSSLKEQAVNAVNNDVVMYPPSSRNRLLPMLSGREDWCVSRQRVWGVPLPIFYHKATGQPLINEDTIAHIRGLICTQGADCWWSLPTEELLPESMRDSSGDYVRGEDTMDVWFDSGSSWASVLKGQGPLGEGGVADMYLEGSDQHRGWFQSSLLTSVAVRGKAPYRAIVTHGFVLDKDGGKMSKSLGNVTSPDDILSGGKFGADVLRFWAAGSDYFQDVHVSNVILDQNRDLLQKLRNTCRFMLGNLSDFDPRRHALHYSSLSKLDQYALHMLSEYSRNAMQAYESLVFSSLCHTLATFVPNDLSAFYFVIAKDRLYCEGEGSVARRAVQTVLYQILWRLLQSVAPIAPHLAEEVAQHAPIRGT